MAKTIAVAFGPPTGAPRNGSVKSVFTNATVNASGVTGGGKIKVKKAEPAPAFTYSPSYFASNAASFYGLTIPVSAGKRAVTGVPIWCSVIRQTGDRAFVDVAYSFGVPGVPEDELVGTIMTKLWMNGRLVYDAETTSGWSVGEGLQFIVYPGSTTQTPDPLISTWLTEAGHSPIAFRGRIYIVFYNLPMHAYELQSLPFVRAELVDTFGTRANVLEFTQLQEANPAPNWLVPDWPTMRLYTLNKPDPSQLFIRTFDMSNNIELMTVQVTGLPEPYNRFGPLDEAHPWYIDPYYGYVMTVTGQDNLVSNKTPTISIDPVTGEVRGLFGVQSSSVVQSNIGFLNAGRLVAARINGVEMTEVLIVQCGRLAGDLGAMYLSETGELSYAWHPFGTELTDITDVFDVLTDGSEVPRHLIQGDLIEGERAATFFTASRRRIHRGVLYNPGSGEDLRGRVDEIWEVPVGYVIHEIFLEPVSDDIIILLSNTITSDFQVARLVLSEFVKGKIVPEIAHPERAALLWVTEPILALSSDSTNPSHLRHVGWEFSNIAGMTLGYASQGSAAVSIINLASGDVSDFELNEWKFDGNEASEPQPITIRPNHMWNSQGSYFIGQPDAGDTTYRLGKIWPVMPPGEAISLGQILRWMLLYNGFTDDQFDIIGIDDLVLGSLVEEVNMSLWDIFADMERVFRFDRYESEGKIKLVKVLRGESLSITWNLDAERDLLPLSGNEVATGEDPAFISSRDWNEDLPAILELQFLDANNEYIVNLARAKRTQFPVKTTSQTGVEELAVPIIMTPVEALGYATKALYDLYERVTTHEYRVGIKHLGMEPSDVTAININGMDYVIKVTETMLNADNSVSVVARGFSNVDNLDIEGESPLSDPQVIPGPSISQLFVLDAPPLSYADAIMFDAAFRLPTLLTSYGQAGWRGARLFLSDAASGPFTEIYSTGDDSSVVGVALSALPHSEAQATDTENELIVQLIIGRNTELPASGHLLLGKTGRWERIQYLSASDEGGGKWILGELVRGIRGTEMHTASHIAGDTAVFSPAPEVLVAFAPASVDMNVYTKTVGVNSELNTAMPRALTLSANYDKPFAPISLKAVENGGDIELSWLRRTRLEHHLGSDLDVPLEFPTEVYDLEIMDGDTVVRTVAGLTTPEYTYAAADIAADLGGVPVSLRFRVYQVSPVVGRGFPGDDTVDVE